MDDEPTSRAHPPVGSLAEEAARLVGAWSQWAGEQQHGRRTSQAPAADTPGADTPGCDSPGADIPGAASDGGSDPTAEDDGPGDRAHPGDCQWCPLCRAADTVREHAPELREQIGAAAAAATAFALDLLQTVADRTDPADRDERGPDAEDRGRPSRPHDEPPPDAAADEEDVWD